LLAISRAIAEISLYNPRVIVIFHRQLTDSENLFSLNREDLPDLLEARLKSHGSSASIPHYSRERSYAPSIVIPIVYAQNTHSDVKRYLSDSIGIARAMLRMQRSRCISSALLLPGANPRTRARCDEKQVGRR
jgi:hypothetical protein